MAYDGKQFEAYVGLAANNNLNAPTVHVSDTLYKMRLDTVEDVDFSNGVQIDDIERTGQRVLRPTDRIAVRGGGTYTWSFSDYVVENEALLQVLLQLATEDTTPAVTASITGDQSTVTYTGGASTGEYGYVVISSPDTDQDRLMHGSILEELTLSVGSGQHGGRLVASGRFWSGFQPVIGTESTTPNSTSVDYTKGLFDCVTNTLAGSAVIIKDFSLTISNPATRVGFATVNSNKGEPQEYNRGGQINVTGSMGVLLNDNSVGMVNNFLGGTSTAIVVGDGGTNINFSIPTAKFDGNDQGYDEDGTFVNLPFKGTAEGSNALCTLTLT